LQKNTGQNGGKPKLDLNVEAAWAQGITGKNVTTAIMDDGEYNNKHFLKTISYHYRTSFYLNFFIKA
jgi:proprotein convertase subtilisin/kexin type 2